MCLRILSIIFFLSSITWSVDAVDWKSGNEGQIRWALNCDFNGGDIGNQKGKGEDCGNMCLARQDCTRFSWTNHEGGTCWLKSGSAQAVDVQNGGSCGEVVKRDPSGPSQPGKSTRYWDCCKPSCSWPEKASVSKPVNQCAKDGGSVLSNPNTVSGCGPGGSSYMCTSQQPWAVNDNLAYGFAAAKIAGQSESNWCCACYALTFTSGPVSGKTMVVQVTNTGGDLGGGHFDLQIPGGGVGIFNGCQSQFNSPSDGWGSRYGGVGNEGQCNQLPAALQSGCRFRFTWFKNADNPNHNFKRVKCPSELTSKTGCVRNDEK